MFERLRVKMGKRREKQVSRSQTLPSSPSHSFSSSTSSDFEFTVSLSPRAATSSSLNPADHLFYKGQLLPLHLSPRLSMVRTLLLSSSSTSTNRTSSSSATASRRDSTASSSSDSTTSCPSSSRPSSASDENINQLFSNHHHHHEVQQQQVQQIKKNKYFSLSRFSSVFNKKHEQEQVNMTTTASSSSSSVKRISASAKQVFKKYFNKVKPLYEKLSHKQEEKVVGTGSSNIGEDKAEAKKESNNGGFSHSFSGNLSYPRRRRSCISSCPSSMRSSPSRSGVLSRNGFTSMTAMNTGRAGNIHNPDHSSMEDLQSAIQGAIAHCKNSLVSKENYCGK